MITFDYNNFDKKVTELSGKLDDCINGQMRKRFHEKLIDQMDDKMCVQMEEEFGWNIRWEVSDLLLDGRF